MKRKLIAFISAMIFMLSPCCLSSCSTNGADTGTDLPENSSHKPSESHTVELPSESDLPDNGFAYSDLYIKISSGDDMAIFRLYDTDAAKELYEQLPLELPVTPFGGAQWMFYPPEKLNVKSNEAYHDGKKGELSYYEPWGDVFMLYQDFYAGDEMHRLGVGVYGVDTIENMSENIKVEKYTENNQMSSNTMYIKIGNTTLTATLVDNSSTRALKEMLPVTINMSDYGNFEKVGSLGKSLPRNDEQISTDAGDLILYQGSSFVIYYDQNSWNFTRLGKINGVTKAELKEILGSGSVTVTLTMDE